jgi:uncharacterized membrane protein
MPRLCRSFRALPSTPASAALAFAIAIAIAAISAPAIAADPFGDTGDVVIGGIASYQHSKADGVSGATTAITAVPRLDVYVAPRWFVGVAPIYGRVSYDYSETLADGTTTTRTSADSAYGLGVRFGRVVPLSDRFALRPVVGLAVSELKVSMTGAADGHATRTSATARLELAFAMTDHVFLTSSIGLLSATFGSGSSSNGYAVVGLSPAPGYVAQLGAVGLGIEGSL